MGGITRRTLLETQDIKESQITASKVLDHTLGSQEFGTSAAIIILGTQIKDDVITAAHVLDHTLGSQNFGTTVGVIVAGTQIKDAIIGTAKIVELQEHGTIAAVTKTGVYLTFDSAFGAAPTLVATPLYGTMAAGTFLYISSLVAGSAQLRLTGDGTVVAHYIARGARV